MISCKHIFSAQESIVNDVATLEHNKKGEAQGSVVNDVATLEHDKESTELDGAIDDDVESNVIVGKEIHELD